MPWNDNSSSGSGNSGSGKPGPWGAPPPEDGNGGREDKAQRPSGGRGGGPKRPRKPPPTGPDLNDTLDRLNARLREFFTDGQGKVRPRAVGTVIAGAAALYLATGVYFVQPDEQAVVTTFGAYSRTTGSGAGYHLPWPVEAVEKVSVTTLNRIDVGGMDGADVPEESLMLTGDENIIDLDFSVQWRVSDASKYLFNVRDPDATVKAVAESAMREVVGRTPLQPVLTTARGQVQEQVAQLMQSVLDRYDAGVFIDGVQIRNANPPTDVIDAFRDVAAAGQNAESAANVARGEAAKVIQAAIGYREQVVREAAGEAARFNQVYEQYRLAPGVTRERLYIETMQRVLANSNKVILDTKGSGPVVLPPDVFRPKASAPTAPTARSGQ